MSLEHSFSAQTATCMHLSSAMWVQAAQTGTNNMYEQTQTLHTHREKGRRLNLDLLV